MKIDIAEQPDAVPDSAVDVVIDHGPKPMEDPGMDTPVDASGGPFVFKDLQVSPAPLVGLSAIVSFETTKPAIGSVVVEEGDIWNNQTIFKSDDSTERTAHQIWISGMRPSKKYRFRPRAHSGAGQALGPESIAFETDPLPADIPTMEFFANQPDKMSPGLTLFSIAKLLFGIEPIPSETATMLAVDDAGSVRWYYRFPDKADNDSLVGTNLLGDGQMGFVGGFGMILLNSRGVEVARFGTDHLGVDFLHHDITRSSDGDYYTLGAELKTLKKSNGQELSGVLDVVIEIDGDGNVINRWPLDAYIDVDPDSIECSGIWDTFFPGQGQTCEITHANQIVWDPSDDTLIVYLVKKTVFVKFDRHTGNLVWKAGHDGTVSIAPGGTWVHNEAHGGLLPLDDGTYLTYDNGEYESDFFPSRAVQYSIKPDGSGGITAKQLWEYRNDFASPGLGNATRLKNGNTLLCNGGLEISSSGELSTGASIVEVTGGDSPEKLMELRVASAGGIFPFDAQNVVFRAFRVIDFGTKLSIAFHAMQTSRGELCELDGACRHE